MRWADTVHEVFTRTQAFGSPDATARWQAARRYQAELAALYAPYLPTEQSAAEGNGEGPREETPAAAAPPQHTRRQRIDEHLTELFVFVTDP